MKTLTVYTGDTKKFTSTFTGYDGSLSDPDSNLVTFKVYNADNNNVLYTDSATRISLGSYEYEYTFSDTPMVYFIEFSGEFGTKPHLGRRKVRARMRA